ncbi:MAG: zinc-ribbon domain-containing protein [Oscillospiraceae bacterium]|nr:zinc-ribbon domain-containing protein [Oscillospiraceae bacterium]
MFCSKCGTQLPDDSVYCIKCGFEIGEVKTNEELNQNDQENQFVQNDYQQASQTPQFTPPPGQQNQQYQPYAQPYVPVYTKPRRPGRGFGISSMVLGIIGMVYSSRFFFSLLTVLYSFAYGSNGDINIYENMQKVMVNFFDLDSTDNIFTFIFTSLVFAILACVFAIISRNKKYRNKISKSGLILSIISFVFVFVFIAFAGYAYSVSPQKEINGGAIHANQFYIGEWSLDLDAGNLILSLNDDGTFEMSADPERKLTGTYSVSRQSWLGQRYLDDGIEITAHSDTGNDITFILTKSWRALDILNGDNFDESGNFKDSSGKLYTCEEPGEYYYLSESAWVGLTGEPTEKVTKLQ